MNYMIVADAKHLFSNSNNKKEKLLIKLIEEDPNLTYDYRYIYMRVGCPYLYGKGNIGDYMKSIDFLLGSKPEYFIEMIKNLYEMSWETMDEEDFEEYFSLDKDTNFHFIKKTILQFHQYGMNFVPIVFILLEELEFDQLVRTIKNHDQKKKYRERIQRILSFKRFKK